MKSSLVTLLLCVFFSSLNAQNIYRWYQDGIVVFQLERSESIIRSTNKYLSIENFDFLKSIENQYGIENLKQLHPNIKDENLSRTYQIEFTELDQIDNLVRHINNISGILYAEKKELHESFLTPNDQYFSNSVNSGQWALYQIEALDAWDISTGSEDVVVAVTDNAITVNHPDLVNKMVAGWDAADNDNDPSPCGGNDGFHGSHVSGIVGAESNNNIGIASIGYNVSIMPVKIGDCNTGALTSGYDGIIWAADNNADVINMSWGGAGSSNYGQNVCNYAWNQGSILIAAAGNDNTNQQFYPAGFNNVVSVASTTTGDARSSFSNYGDWIDIAAPGSSILSTNETTGYQVTQGTSMASPLVAGLVGLMISHAPSATNEEVIQCLYSSADNIDAANPSFIGQLGAGRINAYQALLCMSQFTYSIDAGISNIIEPLGSICESEISPQITLSNFGSNSISSVDIEYQIDNGSINTYNWTGTLNYGESTVITLPTQSPGAGAHTFSVSLSNPNNSEDENPSNNSLNTDFSIVENGQIAELTILTDCYGSETTWQITNSNGLIIASGGPYEDITGGELNVENICIAPGCYTFTINDTYGDGMFGSQWTCEVDGDYYMKNELGETLFEMTAPNGNFGYQTSHEFCINSNLSLDAGISGISYPSGTICGSSINPSVQLNNFGMNSLTNVDIIYSYNELEQIYSWSGNLEQGESETINLPNMAVSNGTYNFTAYTDSPNGNEDLNLFNDQSNQEFTVFTGSTPLPFLEDFESNTFENNSWTITNPDNQITWEIVNVSGNTPGDKAAKIDFYNYENGFERDGLQTPPLDLSNFTNVSMSFEHAFRRYDANSRDSLVLLVSTDCGNTFERIAAYAEDGSGTFATAYTSSEEFIPGNGDWCTGTVGTDCFNIDLSAYDGLSAVVVRFESVNNGIAGNNLFIDNINIDGTQIAVAPTANFSTDPSLCESEEVQFTDNSLSSPTSWSWDFGDGSGFSNEQNPSYTYSSNGTFVVSLVAANNSGSDIYTQEITINTLPSVEVNSAAPEACLGSLVQLTASGASIYSWNNDLGEGSEVTDLLEGTTTYEVFGTDLNGCTASASILITAVELPILSVNSTSNTSDCLTDNGSISLGSSGSGNISWTGASSGEAIGISFPYVIEDLAVGSYFLTYTDNNGCASEEITTSIDFPYLPDAPIIAEGDTVYLCDGASITASSSYTEGNQWSTGASSQTINVNSSGTYFVNYIDLNGCESDSTYLEVIDSPDINLISEETINICTGETVTINANGASDYSWNNGLSSGSDLTVSPEENTVFTLVGITDLGCEFNDEVLVVVNSIPDVSITPSTLDPICFGNAEFITLTGNPTGGSFSGPGIIMGNTLNTGALAVGEYTVEYSYTDNNGCNGFSNLEVVVDECASIQETNELQITLSPNPNNGNFFITGTQEGMTVTIVDSQGREVFNSILLDSNMNYEIQGLERHRIKHQVSHHYVPSRQ